MELELPGRDVARNDRRPEAGELESEPPRAGARLENAHPGPDELAEQPHVHFESDAVHLRRVEPRPLPLAVLVEEACDVLRVVWHAGPRRA